MHLWNTAEVRGINYDDAHPKGKTNVFLQWKNIKVCFDFTCECGAEGHYDGFFAQRIRCPMCGTVWDMPSTVYPRRVEDGDGSYDHEPVVFTLDDELAGT